MTSGERACAMEGQTAIAAVVRAGVARYFTTRHDRVAWFVDRHFSFRGALRLHRAALGWDVARAPLNLVLAGPQAGLQLAAIGARRMGAPALADALRQRRLLRETAVARETAWLIRTDLLELPAQDGARHARRDVLAETILADERIAGTIQPMVAGIAAGMHDPAVRARIEAAIAGYAGTRTAAAEVATALLSLGTGAATLSKLTPGALSFGPALAAALAQQAAVSSFPLGGALGSLWYAAFPAAPSAVMVAGLTGGLMAAASVAAAFAGVVADPVQRQLGLHQRRLHRLLRAMEQQMLDPQAAEYAAVDHYVARLTDLLDMIAAAWRIAGH